MNSQLYLGKDDIKVQKELTDFARASYERVINHEVQGLMGLGCEVISTTEYVQTINSNPSPFYNRIINPQFTSHSSLINFIESKDKPVSMEVNPFSMPVDIEEILINSGAIHTLSSVVIGRNLDKKVDTGSTQYQTRLVHDGDPNLSDLFKIFSGFFLKPGESDAEGQFRLSNNLINGTHILALDAGNPIGMIGSINIDSVASVYAGIIHPDYRATNLLSFLGNTLMNQLIDEGIEFSYMKSRNRAVVLGIRREFSFQYLYNERVYLI